MKKIYIFISSILCIFNTTNLISQVDCGGVALTQFSITNCGVGQSPQLVIQVAVCATQATQGNWLVSYPGGGNTVGFFVGTQPCPNTSNCGTSGPSVINMPGFNCANLNINDIVITNASGQVCAFQQVSSCTLLPLNFLSFEAYKENNFSALEWTTTEEVNVDYFNIQNSQDGINFYNVGKIESQNEVGGSNKINKYSFKHEYNNRLNYYKIVAVDFDKRETHSKISFIAQTKNISNFNVYPNPVGDMLYLTDTDNNNLELTIYDITGSAKIVTKEKVVSVKDLAPGVYFASILMDGQNVTKKFVKN